MYELQQVGEKSYYINSPAKIGIYRQNETDIYLIDSGNDKEAAKKIIKIAAQQNWTIKGIVNTHSNADHIGGNAYLQQQVGCPIFANGIEAAFTQYPILEPSFLYGGYPCKDLRNKFLMAKESRTLPFSDKDFPQELEVIPLPGHFFDMAGFRTPDDTVFLADCISSENTLNKYQVSFIYNVAQYLETLDFVEKIEAARFVPSHAEMTADIKGLVAVNRNKIYEIADTLLEICSTPQNSENILQMLFNKYELSMNIEQYVLVGSTIRSYLSWLKDLGKLSVSFENNMLQWKNIQSSN
ncbi:MBL fold metallo-hydrolase [uncultured Parabacteroides sp.]|uniref:MBL fold metallo-hydrolase n=1 Tax=uncultured Parabacteroides sp. TaxID=512312 RepID=UPI002599F512|nr:MBL fold metallo-hydrolase [uncultured Parabacteroides sp.]